MNNKNKMNRLAKAVTAVATTGVISVAVLTSSSSNADLGTVTKIVGGSESTPYSRPYQVALLMNGRQGCGGTLISPQWVLTAAHCLDSASTSNLTVKVGAHRMSGNDGQTHSVSQIIKHEYWQGAQNIQSGYDIAVLRLSSPASSSATPALLPSQATADQIAGVGSYVTVSGWGLTYNGSRTPSDVLREVALPVISNSSCSSQLGTNLGNGVICGGGPNGTSACNGDSGGPYAVQSGGSFYSIGTVSWGKACSGATAFTRTTAYLDWIEGKTGITPPPPPPFDEKPVARFSHTANELTATFSNNSTDDIGIQSSSWNFGDGSTSNQTNPSHTYAQAGSYTVTLTVTDTINQTNTLAESVTVTTEPCTALTSPSYPTWSATTSYVIGDRVSLNGTNYEATWWSTGATPAIYTNVWKVVDGGPNCPGENEAPTASFSVNTSELTASFSNSSTDDYAVVSHSWNFGDGSTSTSANPSHTYAVDGDYTVTLTVADAEGLTDSTSQTVSVEEGGTNEGCDGLAAWSISTSYAIGDKVSHNGYKYEAIWWSTGASPAVFSNVWTNQGACSN